jgi:hypothetical protein
MHRREQSDGKQEFRKIDSTRRGSWSQRLLQLYTNKLLFSWLKLLIAILMRLYTK